MCGIFGIIGKRSISESIYHGIIQLQHRGQDAAGIFTYDPLSNKHTIHKDLGLVQDVFKTDTLPLPKASWGIGHVRYSTIGKVRQEDTQPLYIQSKHTIAMAHNGNVVNYVALKHELQNQGIIFETTSDLEVILQIFSNALPETEIHFHDICQAINIVYEKVIGAYSIVVLITGVGMVAFRDPKGIRPLLYGYRQEDDAYGFASETNALSVFGCNSINDIKPGEVLFIDKNLETHSHRLTQCKPAHCSFEYDYFSKPNTVIDKREVYFIRSKLGTLLGEKIRKANLHIDVVVPVPSTARPAAISLAKSLNSKYEEGFVKQDYIGRTFIMPTQKCRQHALMRKLAPVKSVFNGKSVLLVDDSIVRGTVSKRVVTLARWAGATKVYFASTYPPIRHPCFYGVDFPNQKQLIAFDKSVEKICEEIDADDLYYNDVLALNTAIGTDHLCNACLTGQYPTEISGKEELQNLRQRDLAELEIAWKS